jgi:hypothetical protein
MGCLAGFLQETLRSYLGETTEHSLQERLGPGRVDGFLDQRFRNIKKGCLADFLQEIYSGERCDDPGSFSDPSSGVVYPEAPLFRDCLGSFLLKHKFM